MVGPAGQQSAGPGVDTILPQSQRAGVAEGSAGVEASLGRCAQCPRAQPGAGTLSGAAGRREARGRVHARLFTGCLQLFAWGAASPPPPPSGWSLPGQVLPAPPRSGKELGVQFLENPGHSRHKERSHMRRPLLPLIEGVPLTEAKSPGRVPERGRWQAWQGPQAPPASHANHVSC